MYIPLENDSCEDVTITAKGLKNLGHCLALIIWTFIVPQFLWHGSVRDLTRKNSPISDLVREAMGSDMVTYSNPNKSCSIMTIYTVVSILLRLYNS